MDPKLVEAHYDAEFAAMPMPPEYKDKQQIILCNDCLKKSKVAWHILGGKCKKCRSYNTTRVEDAKVEEFKDSDEE